MIYYYAMIEIFEKQNMIINPMISFARHHVL